MSASVVADVARAAKAAKASWSQAMIALPAALALAHSLLFFPYVIDDAYITYSSARNLAHGLGPVFMAGERVEATSSMLWTLALAPFELLGVGSLLGSKLLGAACAVWVVLAAPALLRRMQPSATLLQQLTLGVLLAGCTVFVLWTSYGMENGLVALLLLLAIERFGRELQQGHGSLSALPIFLLQTIRPEGFMFIALFVALRLLWVAARPGEKARPARALARVDRRLPVRVRAVRLLVLRPSAAEHGRRQGSCERPRARQGRRALPDQRPGRGRALHVPGFLLLGGPGAAGSPRASRSGDAARGVERQSLLPDRAAGLRAAVRLRRHGGRRLDASGTLRESRGAPGVDHVGRRLHRAGGTSRVNLGAATGNPSSAACGRAAGAGRARHQRAARERSGARCGGGAAAAV